MSLEYRDLLNKLDTLNKKQEVNEGFNKWFKLVFEAPVKTATKSKVDINLEPDTDQPLQTTTKEKPAPKRKKKTSLKMRGAAPMPDLDRIERSIGQSDTDDDYGDLDAPQLGHADDNDTPALGVEPEQTTDLATVSTELAKVPTEVAQRVHNVEWHAMMDLPGNMKQVIRNMGRRVFAAFGEQDFEDIDVISSFTNDEEDLDVVAGLVRQFGVPVQQDNIVDFGDTIPGYKAHVGVWSFGGQYHMFVKDEFGEYIYAWDNTETDKLQHFEPTGGSKDQARLEGINEARNPFVGPVANDPLMKVTYKGYKYNPEVQTEDDNIKLLHNITNPEGKWFNIAPSWFQNITPYEYPTAEEFKKAVDEIEADKS